MTAAERVEINRLIDGTGLNRVNVRLTILAFFVMLVDGYDISALAFAAPRIVDDWGLSGTGLLGPVFSASLVGMFLGAPLFGWLGDRWGRKAAVIVTCTLVGVASLATAFSNTISELLILRVVTGLGMGGLAPNMIALVAEYAPKDVRATMIICMYTGITLGSAVVGATAAWLLSSYGWEVLFVIGGVAPLVMSALAAAFMPESIKYLAMQQRRSDKVRSLLSAVTGRVFAPGTTFVLEEGGSVEPTRKVTSPIFLFRNGLAPITLSLWLCKGAAYMGFYFLMNWMPTLLEQANFVPQTAALASSLFHVGGTVGGLALSLLIDRRGVGVIALLFVCAVPIVCAIGYVGGNDSVLYVLMFLGGFCALGIQFGLNAVASIIYPTYCRAYALGWFFAVGRIGAIAGPIVGGLIIELGVGIRGIFLLASIPYLVGAAGSVWLGRVYLRASHESAGGVGGIASKEPARAA